MNKSFKELLKSIRRDKAAPTASSIMVQQDQRTVGNAIEQYKMSAQEARKSAQYWELEAKRYAGNADFWRGRAGSADTRTADLESFILHLRRRAVNIDNHHDAQTAAKLKDRLVQILLEQDWVEVPKREKEAGE